MFWVRGKKIIKIKNNLTQSDQITIPNCSISVGGLQNETMEVMENAEQESTDMG